MKLIKIEGLSYTFEIEDTDDIEAIINVDTTDILYETENHKNQMATATNKMLTKCFKEE